MPGGFSYIGDLTIQESTGEITSPAVGDKALLSTAADDSTLEVSSTTGKMQVKAQGSSLTAGVQRSSMSKYAGTWIRGALATTRTGGGIFSLENTYGTDLIIDRVIIQVTTASSAAATIDVGIAGGGTSTGDNCLDGLDVGTAAGVFDNITDKGTNGKSRQRWGSGGFLTASEASGNITGMVGFYGIHVIDISA